MVKQVIVIRKDLNMRKGKMVAQGAHASLASALKIYGSKAFKHWIKSGMTKIVVSVNSEKELWDIYQKALGLGVNASLVVDAGKTEFRGVPTNTAVAIGPAQSALLDGLSGNMKLL